MNDTAPNMTVLSMVPNDTPYLPPKVTEIAKETLRNFPHSKKVGNYLLGNTLGEGSFAKVKEALHIPTGERVGFGYENLPMQYTEIFFHL